MTNACTILAGSVSQGIWRSPDSGQTWRNFHGKAYPPWAPFNLESQVRALAVDPNDEAVIYAGDEIGICKSVDRGDNWERLHGPIDGLTIWSIAVDPNDSNTVFAGSRPPYLFRSKDAGKSWEKLAIDLPQECVIGVPRVLAMKADPKSGIVWAGIEVGGVYKSLDGGDSWWFVESGFEEMDVKQDIHDITLVQGATVSDVNGHAEIVPGEGTTVIVNAQFELLATSDGGESWRRLLASKEELPLPYMRSVCVRPDDPRTIFIGLGDVAIGSTGGIVRSRNGGASWELLKLPVEPNSGVFCLSIPSTTPDLIVASTLFGQFYLSEDGGDTWTKLRREVNELRALVCIPN